MSRILALAVLLVPIAFSPVTARATEYILTLKDHQFSPQNLLIPAHQKITITVKNLQSSPAEFESSDLDREKVVNANSEIKVILGPLDPGTYKYLDDFHRDTQGTITAK